jgi:CheY-like chemotaxis protein/signal transduction histidine kinase/CHASE3 domain sensor protein
MKNIKMMSKLLLVFSVNLVIFLVLLTFSHQSFTTMVGARNAALHASEVLDKVNDIRIRLLELRASKRDFGLTGRREAIDRIGVDAANLRSDFGALRELTQNTPMQQRNVELLQEQYGRWVNAELSYLLGGEREGMPVAEVRELVLSEPGLQSFQAALATVERISKDERANVEHNSEEMLRLQTMTAMALTVGGVLAMLIGGLLSVLVAYGITRPLTRLTAYARRIALGDYAFPLEIDQKDEIGDLAREFRTFQGGMIEKTRVTELIAAGDLSPSVAPASDKDTLGNSINRMVESLRQARERSERTDWVKTGLNDLGLLASMQTDPRRLADEALSFLVPYLGAQVATLYLADAQGGLELSGTYAADPGKIGHGRIAAGQGIVGQAALERRPIVLDPVPDDYVRVTSSLGESAPRTVMALPFSFRDTLVGVVEIGSLGPFPADALQFLQGAAETLAVSFDTLNKQARLRELLERTQEQAYELQQQQEELKTSNEELEEHTMTLQQSEEELKQQREELQAVNEELEEKNDSLERQKALIVEKSRDLELASRYKSEFLANMSHELRTPLNSLLLLARSLHENRSGALSPDDVEAAGIIHKNGTDLLHLINDILDLSKIEAGKVNISRDQVPLEEVAGGLMLDFRHLAEEKGLALHMELAEGLPGSIRTDRQRLEQILRNLLSNAVKFTESGGVTLRIGPGAGRTVDFEVVDTGIGIPKGLQEEIFQAFQQGDGSTSRRYGGTGLGLTIARQLATLLGGEITLRSEPGKGSTFALSLPIEGGRGAASPARFYGPRPSPGDEPAPIPQQLEVEPSPAAGRGAAVPDDRAVAGSQDRTILIVEDDLPFATILRDLCREKGFKALVASTGEEGLALADRHQPTGIILDIRLPGISGWTVLGSLKRNHRTRHIPVHIVSVHEAPHEALIMGAVGFLSKPAAGEDIERAFERIESVAEKKVKDLLLVEDSADLRKGILMLLEDLGVQVTEAETGRQALEAIKSRQFDCMILDLGLADMSGFDLLRKLEEEKVANVPPVIVYTGRDLSREEERELLMHAESIIVKGARSEERLLDEAALFLHRMVSSLPKTKQRMILDLHNRDAALEGCKVLLVDDDMRNLFALSRVLTEKGLKVVKAEDGVSALEALDNDPGIDIVLMDLMMPVMDGYEAMRRIRSQKRFGKLPIIALTAKAMKEDREKCLEAGANDYIAKPVDLEKMLSMMRVWLYGKRENRGAAD